MNFVINASLVLAFSGITNSPEVSITKAKANDGTSVAVSSESYTADDATFEEFSLVSQDGIVFNFGGGIATQDALVFTTPIIEFARQKHIITTPINDYNEVYQQWAVGNYELSIRGLVVDMQNHQYPSEGVKKIRNLFETTKYFKVEGGKIFEDLGITEVIISDFRARGITADTWEYELSAKSIKPYNFFIINQ